MTGSAKALRISTESVRLTQLMVVTTIRPVIQCISEFQLAIKDGLFSLPSVEALIKKARDLVSFANQSTVFYTEFYKQQALLGITDRRTLKQDVATR